VAGGSDTLAQQSSTLAGGSGELSSSASQLDSGAASLAQGAATVDSSAAQLAAGASSASQAGGSLASGSRSLASSAGQVDSGAQSLSSGLAKGAKQSPTYSSSQQKALLPVVSQPTELTSQVQHTGYGNGWLIALIIAVVLWLSGLLAALGADVAVIGRHATAPVGSGRLALSQAVPVVGLGVLQAAVVTVATMLLHGGTAAVVPLALLTLLAAVTFSVLALAFRLALGSRLGVTLFVLLLVLQLAASSNVIPLETAPGVLQRLNALLPLTVFVNGASQLVSGGHVASLVAVAVVLALWAAVACAALMVAVRRHRLSRSFGPAAVGVAT
jgi:putative membrane protein